MSAIGNNYRPSADEIRYNLREMKSTLDKGRVVDAGFIDIFREAIAALPAGEQKSLNTRLHSISSALNSNINKTCDRADKAAHRAAFNPNSNPRVGAVATIETIANEYTNLRTDARIIQGLTELSADFACRRIRGDGHCLFRAVGAGLLESCQHLNTQEKEAKIAFINAQLERLVGTRPDHRLHQLKAAVTGAIRTVNPQNADQMARNDRLSNSMVEFLRLLATEEILKRPAETLSHELAGRQLSRQDYCRGMARLDPAWEGGPNEMQAMGNCLDVELNVHDVTILAESSYVSTYGNQRSLTQPQINLLYRPNHYDLLVDRQDSALPGA